MNFRKSIILLAFFAVLAPSCVSKVQEDQKEEEEQQGFVDDFADYKDPDYMATLSKRIGKTPVVVAYTTENCSYTMDPKLVTHINYGHGRFANPSTGDGGITIAKPELLKAIVALKKQNPDLKVLLMIGGWGTKADGFSQCAGNMEKRVKFARNIKQVIDEYGLDGVDLDWEYPTNGGSGIAASANDTKNFTYMVRDIRRRIGTDKLLTFASHSGAEYVNFPAVMKYVDYVNVMTYDMGDPPYHNAPLYTSPLNRKLSSADAIEAHHKLDVPYERMTLGIPFYGHGISPFDDDVKYNQMESKVWSKGIYMRMWDDKAKVPYVVAKDNPDKMLISYEDAESIGYKTEYALSKKLLGVMYWEYRHDDDKSTLRNATWYGMHPEDK